MSNKKQISNSVKKESSSTDVKQLFNFKPGTVKLILVVFVILLFGKTIGYEFTLDDDIFYVKHQSVQQGISNIAELFTHGSMEKFDGNTTQQPYRPITLTSFAIEKSLFDNNPAASHFINVLLYALIGISLYNLFRKLFPEVNSLFHLLAILLFLAHPIHTEVVANIKGRDELLAALFGFMAWNYFLNNNNDAFSLKNSLISSVLLFLALLSKESAIAFLVTIPLSIFILKRKSIKETVTRSFPLITFSVVFLILRQVIVGSKTESNAMDILANVLSGTNSVSEAIATRFEILFYYLKLLFVPWPLNWDYSFNQIPIVNFSNITPWLGIISYVVLIVLAIWLLKKKPIYSFSILFFLISSLPTNNIFFLNGATIGERFLFVPSLGFILAVSFIIKGFFEKVYDTNSTPKSNKLQIVFLSLIGIYSILSWNRTSDWKNNMTLFTAGVENGPNSSRTHYSLASQYMEQLKTAAPLDKQIFLQKSMEHFAKSIDILPQNFQAHYNLALLHQQIGDTSKAIKSYKNSIQHNPNYISAVANLGSLYERNFQFDTAEKYYLKAYEIDSKDPISSKNLASVYYNKGIFWMNNKNPSMAINYYLKSAQYNPSNAMAYNNIGSYYASQLKYDSALFYLKKAVQADPQGIMAIENVAAISLASKQYDQAIEYAKNALKLNPQAQKATSILQNAQQAKLK